jgi:DNA-binding MarR family transcriptional regulator
MSDRLQVHRTSITNTIDGLERSGLVRRTPHQHDRRTVLAEILPEGRRVAEAATDVLNDAAFGTSPLSARQLESLFRILRTLRAEAGDIDA